MLTIQLDHFSTRLDHQQCIATKRHPPAMPGLRISHRM